MNLIVASVFLISSFGFITSAPMAFQEATTLPYLSRSEDGLTTVLPSVYSFQPQAQSQGQSTGSSYDDEIPTNPPSIISPITSNNLLNSVTLIITKFSPSSTSAGSSAPSLLFSGYTEASPPLETFTTELPVGRVD